MKKKTKTDPITGLKANIYTLDSGLTVNLVPIKGFNEENAFLYTKYGNMDMEFEEEGQIIKAPAGTAHFLEHKMFEMPGGHDIFHDFVKNGANANAYTGADITNYLFSSTDKFKENIDLLVDYVYTPYFTKDTVEKEMGIIGEEIKGSLDSPGFAAHLGIMECLYQNNPVRENVVGTKESIAEITPELLYSIHEKFYHPSNMSMIIVGNKDKRIVKHVDKLIKEKGINYQDPPKVVYPHEPEDVNEKFKKINMLLARPYYTFGFKNNLEQNNNLKGKELLKMHVTCDLMMQTIFDASFELYNKLLEDDLIDNQFGGSYYEGRGYAIASIGGMGDYTKLEKRLIEELEELQIKGINAEDLDLNKRKTMGSFLRSFNSPTGIIAQYTHYDNIGASALDYLSIVQQITKEDVDIMFRKVINTDNYSLFVVEP